MYEHIVMYVYACAIVSVYACARVFWCERTTKGTCDKEKKGEQEREREEEKDGDGKTCGSKQQEIDITE